MLDNLDATMRPLQATSARYSDEYNDKYSDKYNDEYNDAYSDEGLWT
jgi:hypothetical protein